MQKISTLAICLIAACTATHAHALSYDMQGGLSNPQDCNIADSYWRTDELTQDAYGSYTDPYAYGALTHSDLSYPLRSYAGADDVYYAPEFEDSDSQAQGGMYEYGDVYGGYAGNDNYSVDAIAAANLQRAMGGGTTTPVYTTGQSGSGAGGSARGGRIAQATSSDGQTGTKTGTPKCTLIPRATNSNSVILEWQTVGASSAFIDQGIGHVILGTGTRMVTPRTTTTFNMTVVDGRGFSSQCAAIVHVVGSQKQDAATTIVGGVTGDGMANTSQSTGGTTTITNATEETTDANSGDAIGVVSNTASQIGGNVTDKVTSVLSSGQSIWDKMRQMSLVAIGLFVIIFIIIFVMRKMFGGADEGHH